MLQILILGMILLMTSSCNVPNVKDPVYTCVINTGKSTARCGERSLNYKNIRRKVGEWVVKPTNFDIHRADNMLCFDLQDWLERIKPSLKEGHDLWSDNRD